MTDKQAPTIEEALIAMKFDSHMRGMRQYLMETEGLDKEAAFQKAWSILQPKYKEQLDNLNKKTSLYKYGKQTN